MGSKQVRLDEDVYARIQDQRRPDETFSEAIDRLTSDWSLVEWARKYDSDADELDEVVDAVEQTDLEKTGAVVDQMDVE